MNKPAKIVGSGIQGTNSSADALAGTLRQPLHPGAPFYAEEMITAKRMTLAAAQSGGSNTSARPEEDLCISYEMKMREMTTRDPAPVPRPYVTESEGEFRTERKCQTEERNTP